MDTEKMRTVVTSYKFLELMGDFGGFMEVVLIVFTIVGNSFSSRSFLAFIVEENYA